MTQTPNYRKPVQITDKTCAHFKPVIDATSATLNGNTATQWTGAPALAHFNDATRTIQTLVVEARNSRCLPPGSVLHVLAQVPQLLHMAACRLISEGLPAMLNGAEDKEEAGETVKQLLNTFNSHLHPNLMALHQIMQSEAEQMREVESWTGQGGLLIDATQVLMMQFLVMTGISSKLAPQSNPQARMLGQEARMYFKALEGTLLRCAS